MDYEFLDLTSDVMFRAYGNDEAGLFVNAAKAMFSVICEIEAVSPLKKVSVSVEGEDLEDLLYGWLSALLTESEVREMFFSEFHIDGIGKSDSILSLSGWAKGEAATVEKGGTLVKGVTYYEFGIEKKGDGLTATVTLDI